MQGKIYKALSGFYYIHNGDSSVICTARGRFRNEKETPLVGDTVEYSMEDPNFGRIEKIEREKTALFVQQWQILIKSFSLHQKQFLKRSHF